jgi:hypothetical protein
MTDNETEKFETPPPPPPAPPEPPRTRWRDRRVGVVTLAVSTVAALFIGGTFGTAAGGLVGYGVGHHNSRPDGPEIMHMHSPQGMPDRPHFLAPNG